MSKNAGVRWAWRAAWHGQAGAQQSATTREAAVQEDHGPEHEAPGDHEYDEAHDTVDAAHTAYVERGPPGRPRLTSLRARSTRSVTTAMTWLTTCRARRSRLRPDLLRPQREAEGSGCAGPSMR